MRSWAKTMRPMKGTSDRNGNTSFSSFTPGTPTSSPRAASIKGVEAVMTVRTSACRMSMNSLRRRHARCRGPRREAQAIKDEGVTGEDEEQEYALEHPGDLVRDSKGHLSCLAAHVAQRQNQAGEDHAQWVEPA